MPGKTVQPTGTPPVKAAAEILEQLVACSVHPAPVLANILATPLKVLAPLLCGHVAAGGALVLAGVLERQTAELQAAYQPWLALEVAAAEDGWVLLVGRRP